MTAKRKKGFDFSKNHILYGLALIAFLLLTIMFSVSIAEYIKSNYNNPYYILGTVVLVFAILGAYFLFKKILELINKHKDRQLSREKEKISIQEEHTSNKKTIDKKLENTFKNLHSISHLLSSIIVKNQRKETDDILTCTLLTADELTEIESKIAENSLIYYDRPSFLIDHSSYQPLNETETNNKKRGIKYDIVSRKKGNINRFLPSRFGFVFYAEPCTDNNSQADTNKIKRDKGYFTENVPQEEKNDMFLISAYYIIPLTTLPEFESIFAIKVLNGDIDSLSGFIKRHKQVITRRKRTSK